MVQKIEYFWLFTKNLNIFFYCIYFIGNVAALKFCGPQNTTINQIWRQSISGYFQLYPVLMFHLTPSLKVMFIPLSIFVSCFQTWMLGYLQKKNWNRLKQKNNGDHFAKITKIVWKTSIMVSLIMRFYFVFIISIIAFYFLRYFISPR